MLGRFLAFCVIVAAAVSAGSSFAADRPTRNDVWDIKLGSPVTALPESFTDLACGTNGGPPSLPLDDFTQFTKCRPEADGLREVYFRYDDELEYWARANNFDTLVAQYAGTKEYGYPVILSVLVRSDGIVAGIRVVSDPRDTSTSREDDYQLGTFLQSRFGKDKWTCSDVPAGPGETPVDGIFVKQHCEMSTAQARLTLDVDFLRKPGESRTDPVTGQLTVGQFESVTRFEMRLAG